MSDHTPPNPGYPPLAVMRAAGKSRPCSWCGAVTGKPCRAERGAGPELLHFVHPARLRAARPEDENPT